MARYRMRSSERSIPLAVLAGVAGLAVVAAVALGFVAAGGHSQSSTEIDRSTALVVQGRECKRSDPPEPVFFGVLIDRAGLHESPNAVLNSALFDALMRSGGIAFVGGTDPADAPLLQLRVPQPPAPIRDQGNAIMQRLCEDAYADALSTWRAEQTSGVDAFRSQAHAFAENLPANAVDIYPVIRRVRDLVGEAGASGQRPHVIWLSGREQAQLGCFNNQGDVIPEGSEYFDGYVSWVCVGSSWKDKSQMPLKADGSIDFEGVRGPRIVYDTVPLPEAVVLLCVKASTRIAPLDERCNESFGRAEDAVAYMIAAVAAANAQEGQE